jgi:anaerobic selenocysteine-containing dehydrogenase
MMKAVLALDAESQGTVLDRAFIAEHTEGFETVKAVVEALSWDEIEAGSGLSRAQIEEAARAYAGAKATILCYGMGLTQHRSSSSTVQQLVNLLLLKGNIGRPGAGICPLRGHSNVQGDRTVGIWEKPSAAFLDAMDRVFAFKSPREHGHTVVEAIAAMEAGETKVFVGLGGNFAVAAPDPVRTFAAIRQGRPDRPCRHQAEPHPPAAWPGKPAAAVPGSHRNRPAGRRSPGGDGRGLDVDGPRLARPQRPGLGPAEVRAGHHRRDRGGAVRAGRHRRLAGPGRRLRQDPRPDRGGLPEAFANYNERVRQPGGFRLPVPPSDRVWKTPSGKAQFLVHRHDGQDARRGQADVLLLTTLRSHDQYNTTIYGQNDRYRGVFGRRDVVFAHPDDIAARGLKAGDRIDLTAAFDDTGRRAVRGFTLVERDIPRGCLAAYYPETNVLVALEDHDRRSGTPAYKSVPVRLAAHAG